MTSIPQDLSISNKGEETIKTENLGAHAAPPDGSLQTSTLSDLYQEFIRSRLEMDEFMKRATKSIRASNSRTAALLQMMMTAGSKGTTTTSLEDNSLGMRPSASIRSPESGTTAVAVFPSSGYSIPATPISKGPITMIATHSLDYRSDIKSVPTSATSVVAKNQAPDPNDVYTGTSPDTMGPSAPDIPSGRPHNSKFDTMRLGESTTDVEAEDDVCSGVPTPSIGSSSDLSCEARRQSEIIPGVHFVGYNHIDFQVDQFDLQSTNRNPRVADTQTPDIIKSAIDNQADTQHETWFPVKSENCSSSLNCTPVFVDKPWQREALTSIPQT